MRTLHINYILFGLSTYIYLGVSALASSSILAANVLAPRTTAPKLKLEFTAYLNPDIGHSVNIPIPEGLRVNAAAGVGNWTALDGELFATALPGIGGEQGYVDPSGLFHVDARYTVQFENDKTYAFVHWVGLGILNQKSKSIAFIETNSTINARLTVAPLYAPGTFVGSTLVVPHYSFV